MINHPTLLVNVLIVAGEGFWVFSISAQLVRLAKTRNTHGLSAPAMALNTASCVAWTTYFFVNHLWFPVVSNVIMFFLGATTLAYILSNRRQFAKGMLAIAVIAPITSYALITHPGAGGWLGMAYNWVADTPWLYRVVKRKKVTGLSEYSIYLALSALTCVLAYALIINSWPLIFGCLQSYVYKLIILRFYYRYRHAPRRYVRRATAR